MNRAIFGESITFSLMSFGSCLVCCHMISETTSAVAFACGTALLAAQAPLVAYHACRAYQSYRLSSWRLS